MILILHEGILGARALIVKRDLKALDHSPMVLVDAQDWHTPKGAIYLSTDPTEPFVDLYDQRSAASATRFPPS